MHFVTTIIDVLRFKCLLYPVYKYEMQQALCCLITLPVESFHSRTAINLQFKAIVHELNQ